MNTRLIDSYLELLQNLSRPAKLALIAKLSKSVRKNPKPEHHTFEQAFGAWDNSDNTERLTRSIRTSRNFSRKIADL
ncbi:MAG: hypothetical protein ACHQRM_07250 [Bacteroidia bacterium]